MSATETTAPTRQASWPWAPPDPAGCRHAAAVLAYRDCGQGGTQYVRWCRTCGKLSPPIAHKALTAAQKARAVPWTGRPGR